MPILLYFFYFLWLNSVVEFLKRINIWIYIRIATAIFVTALIPSFSQGAYSSIQKNIFSVSLVSHVVMEQ